MYTSLFVEDYTQQGCYALQSGRYLQIFQKKLHSPSSEEMHQRLKDCIATDSEL
jgi:hypothetical protein